MKFVESSQVVLSGCTMNGDVIAAFVITDPNNQIITGKYVKDCLNSKSVDVKQIRALVYTS